MRSFIIPFLCFLFLIFGAALATYGARELVEAKRIRAEADVVLRDAQQQIREAARLNEETAKALRK